MFWGHCEELLLEHCSVVVVFTETDEEMFSHDEIVKAQQQNYSMKTYLNAEFCFSSCKLFKQSIARGKNRQSCISKFLLNIQGGQRWQGLRVKLEEPSFMWFKHKHSQHTIFLFNLLMMDVLTFDIPLKKIFQYWARGWSMSANHTLVRDQMAWF